MPPRKSPSSSTSESALTVSEILASEFNYIATSAFQANEDRSKSASFFVVSVGSLVAAILGTQELDRLEVLPANLFIVIGVLFFVLAFLGGLTIAQLARLRTAWHESVQAMNQIKTYVVEKFPELELEKAFRWTDKTIPPLYKTNSISYHTVIEVAVLSGLTFGAGVFYFLLGIQFIAYLWPLTIGLGVLVILFQLFIYKKLLQQ